MTETRTNRQTEDATILAALKAHAASKTYAEIAAMLRMPMCRVTRAAVKAGFRKRYVIGASRRARLASHHAPTRRTVAAYARTHTLAEVGRMLGLTREWVRQLCQKWHIRRPNLRLSPLRRMSRRQLRKLIRQPDKTLKEIARAAGVCPDTLRKEFRRRGIKPFTKRERKAALMKRGLKRCPSCRTIRTLAHFGRNPARRDGLHVWCLKCNRLAAKKRRN